MKMIRNKIIYLFLISILFSGCSSIPKNTADGCSIFSERYLWYKHAKKTEQKWGTPINLQLAIIKMESDFDWLAKPPRQNYLKLFLIKDHQVLLVILKQLEEPGSNTKRKQETNMLLGQDLKTV